MFYHLYTWKVTKSIGQNKTERKDNIEVYRKFIDVSASEYNPRRT